MGTYNCIILENQILCELYMPNNDYKRDIDTINQALKNGIKTQNGRIDWKYFIDLIKRQRDEQINALIEVSDSFVESVMNQYNRRSYDDTSYNCIFYHILEPLIEEMKNWGVVSKSLRHPAVAQFIWNRIYELEKTPKKLDVFLAWLWRDHEEVAKKFYRDIGLDARPYQYPSNTDHPQKHANSTIIEGNRTDQQLSNSVIREKKVPPIIRYTVSPETGDNPFHETLITYQGRVELLDKLEAFASDGAKLKVWAISGSSGSGKTRLSHQWMQRSSTMQDWDQIILGNHDRNNDHKRDFWEKWTPIRPTLLVIDYLYVYSDAFDAMLKQCMAMQTRGGCFTKYEFC